MGFYAKHGHTFSGQEGGAASIADEEQGLVKIRWLLSA